MITSGYLLVALVAWCTLLLCARAGFSSVHTSRLFVTPAQGWKHGGDEGAIIGVILFACVMALVLFPSTKSLAAAEWPSLLILMLATPFASALAGSVGGWLAALQKKDPWVSRPMSVAPQAFGPGSLHPFGWYLQRESTVTVKSLADICCWLQDCAYTKDIDQFHTIDHWQHPVDFERTRQGDCEDHALWAWRKLIELGYAAEFMVGTSYRYQAQGEYHAWVVFDRQEKRYMLEAAHKRAQMIAALPAVKHLYAPDYGVDQQLQTLAYNGK